MVISSLLLGMSVLLAQDRNNLDEGRALSVDQPADSVPLTAGFQGIAASSVTVGAQATGLPCFNCVANQTTLNLGLSMPLAVLTQGSAITITVTFENLTYNGPCSVVYSFKQGKTTLKKGSYSYPSGCSTESVYNATYFNTTVPSAPGSTVLQAVVEAGTIKSAVTENLTIQ